MQYILYGKVTYSIIYLVFSSVVYKTVLMLTHTHTHTHTQKTHAYHAMSDDVSEPVKKRRLQEIIHTFYSHVGERNRRLVNTHQLVLVEGVRLYVHT